MSHMKKTVPFTILSGLTPRDTSDFTAVSFVARQILCVRLSATKTNTFLFQFSSALPSVHLLQHGEGNSWLAPKSLQYWKMHFLGGDMQQQGVFVFIRKVFNVLASIGLCNFLVIFCLFLGAILFEGIFWPLLPSLHLLAIFWPLSSSVFMRCAYFGHYWFPYILLSNFCHYWPQKN